MGVTVAEVRVAANTSTGTQDITTPDLGGLTPKAVLLIATRAVTDGVAVDGAGLYLGMTDGTNTLNQAYEEEHGAPTSDVQSKTDLSSPPLLIIYDGTADDIIEGSADFSAWITDGIRINWTDAPASAFLITAVFFAGTDLSAACLLPTSLGDTTDLATDITAIGFESDVFIPMLCHSGTGVGMAMGLVHNNRSGTVTQRSVNYFSRNGQATLQVFSVMRADAGVAEYSTGGVFDWRGEFSSFDSSGFTVTTRNAGGNSRQMGGLALRFGASPVVASKVYTSPTPTSTGSHTDSNPGFQPQFVLYLMNRAQTAAIVEGDADAGPFGILVTDADDTFSNTIASEDGAADSNTQSLSDDKLNLTTHTGASGHEATLTSMGSTGPVWNYSATDGIARLWAALAIQTGSSALTGDVGQVTETDTAQAITTRKSRAVAQATETDVAQSVSAQRRYAVVQVSETDLAQVVTYRKQQAVGQVTELDIAQAITKAKRLAVGQVSETDAAQTITYRKQQTVGQITETDLAQAITKVKRVAISQVVEIELAQAITPAKRIAVNQITETDLAQGISVIKRKAIGQVTETDTSQSITSAKRYTIGQVQETDLAQTVTEQESGQIVVEVEQVFEVDLAQSLTPIKRKQITQVLETDSAQVVQPVKRKQVTQVEEVNVAQSLTISKRKTIGQATETNLSQTITSVKRYAIGQVTEVSLAQSLTYLRRVQILQVSEVDSATGLVIPKIRFVGIVTETDIAFAIVMVGAIFPPDVIRGKMYTRVSLQGKMYTRESLEGKGYTRTKLKGQSISETSTIGTTEL